jgi:hypothetical protein
MNDILKITARRRSSDDQRPHAVASYAPRDRYATDFVLTHVHRRRRLRAYPFPVRGGLPQGGQDDDIAVGCNQMQLSYFLRNSNLK